VALLLTTASVGAEVLFPRGSPEVWAYAFAGPNFSVDTDLLTGAFDPSGQITFNPYLGAVWNVHSPGDYEGTFFCSQASSQVIKGAITHMDFSWFRDLGPNWRDPLTLSAALCASPSESQTYSLTFGRDRTFSNPRFRLSSSVYYYWFAKSLSYDLFN
jgi:hypothetical protein